MPADETPRLTVVMPVYNERATVCATVERVLSVDLAPLELIVVDDGSTDGSRELLREAYARDPRVVLLLSPENRGKGAACREGFARARGRFVVVQDADAEYDPEELALLLGPLERDEADVVYGSRYLAAPPEVRRSWHTRANRVFTELSNLITPIRLSDVHTCYKMVRRASLARLTLREDGFGMDQELTIKLALLPGTRFLEVPIGYEPRNYAAGKKLGARDAARIAWCVLRYGVPGRVLRRV